MTIMMAPFMSCGARGDFRRLCRRLLRAKRRAGGLLAVRAGYCHGGINRPDAEAYHYARRSFSVCDGAAGLPRPAYQEPDHPDRQRLKGFVLRAGKVIIIVSIFLSAFNSFSLSGKIVDNINDSALASVSRVITPVFKPIGVHEDNWQATVGLFTGAMAKEVVVGTLNTLYTAENIQDEAFNPADFHLGDELLGAVDDTGKA